jgi:hypothetical protein
MSNAEELTAITVDFLAEHTNEAALAVVLGIVWHLVWERPKHLPNVAEAQHTTPADSIPENRTIQTQLRGNLKRELQTLLHENEELERIVRGLRSEIEGKDQFSSPKAAYYPMSMHPTRKRIRNAGIIRTTIGMTTNEFDALGSCWALLVFGFCLVSSRRRRRRDNPLSTTIVMLEKLHSVTNDYAEAEMLPALRKIRMYLGNELHELHGRITDPESSTGKAIVTFRETLQSHFGAFVGSTETVVYDRIVPVAGRLTKQGVEYTRLVVNTIAAIEMPKWKESPPTVLLSEHEEKIQHLEDSLNKETSEHKTLQVKADGLEQALRGKEVLLYEERMKTRSARLEATKVTIEREETRRRESQDTKTAALAAVTEEQRRLLHGYLGEHILSRQQQDHLRRIEEKNAPKKSKIVLPDPILQGFASAMYIKNLSDLSSGEYTAFSERPRVAGVSGDHPTDCRDDAGEQEEEYYGNPNETRLREIKEQFLRSRTAASSLRPSNTDPLEGNQASTGSLLWSAANPATRARYSKTKKHHPSRNNDISLATRGAVSQQPSSWMEDPASIMCDWRTNGNDEELRE